MSDFTGGIISSVQVMKEVLQSISGLVTFGGSMNQIVQEKTGTESLH